MKKFFFRNEVFMSPSLLVGGQHVNSRQDLAGRQCAGLWPRVQVQPAPRHVQGLLRLRPRHPTQTSQTRRPSFPQVTLTYLKFFLLNITKKYIFQPQIMPKLENTHRILQNITKKYNIFQLQITKFWKNLKFYTKFWKYSQNFEKYYRKYKVFKLNHKILEMLTKLYEILQKYIFQPQIVSEFWNYLQNFSKYYKNAWFFNLEKIISL